MIFNLELQVSWALQTNEHHVWEPHNPRIAIGCEYSPFLSLNNSTPSAPTSPLRFPLEARDSRMPAGKRAQVTSGASTYLGMGLVK